MKVDRRVLKMIDAECSFDGEFEIESVSIDSRTLKKGDFFVALPGEKTHGNLFVRDALEKGASGALVSDRELAAIKSDVPVIVVRDTVKALHELARHSRMERDIPFVAITGSNGKTTTKELASWLLAGSKKVFTTPGNFNNELGMPLALLTLGRHHEVGVVELGMSGFGEIKRLASIVRPTVGVVTTVGPAHLLQLKTLANVAKAKSELVEALDSRGTAILNHDNRYTRAMRTKTSARTVMFGLSKKADIFGRITNVYGVRGFEFEFSFRGAQGRSYVARTPLVGVHNLGNCLAAIAIALELGMEPQEITGRMESFENVSRRMQIVVKNGITFINDAYNANPVSMAAAIETLSSFSTGRKIAVLGDMLELGSHATRAHRQIGRLAASKEIDRLFVVGKLGRIIGEEAKKSGLEDEAVFFFDTTEEASQKLPSLISEGDTVLLKASRRLKFETILERLAK